MSDPIDPAKIVAEIEKRVKSLSDFRKNAREAKSGNSWDTAALLQVLERGVQSQRLDPDLRVLCEQWIDDARRAVDQTILELDARTRELCAEHNWRVDGEWPSLFVERAIEVRFDSDRRRLYVAGRKLPYVSLELLASLLSEATKSLIPRAFSVSDFSQEFKAAYDELSSIHGSSVPIKDMYRAMVIRAQPSRFWENARSEDYVEMNVEQFRARLNMLLEGSLSDPSRDLGFRFFPPINPEDALFLYLPGDRRFAFIGRVEFPDKVDGK